MWEIWFDGMLSICLSILYETFVVSISLFCGRVQTWLWKQYLKLRFQNKWKQIAVKVGSVQSTGKEDKKR
jgi:hypothetical protein